MNYVQGTYTYDGNNNQIESFYQNWVDGAWKNSSKTLLSYSPVTAINEDIKPAISFKLYQNYPNPFNPSTSIRYAIRTNQFVLVKVYDMLGNEVATLVNEEKPAGNYEVRFNTTQLPGGVYFYKLQAGNFSETRKMILRRNPLNY